MCFIFSCVCNLHHNTVTLFTNFFWSFSLERPQSLFCNALVWVIITQEKWRFCFCWCWYLFIFKEEILSCTVGVAVETKMLRSGRCAHEHGAETGQNKLKANHSQTSKAGVTTNNLYIYGAKPSTHCRHFSIFPWAKPGAHCILFLISPWTKPSTLSRQLSVSSWAKPSALCRHYQFPQKPNPVHFADSSQFPYEPNPVLCWQFSVSTWAKPSTLCRQFSISL